jgi:ribose transport system permease protein
MSLPNENEIRNSTLHNEAQQKKHLALNIGIKIARSRPLLLLILIVLLCVYMSYIYPLTFASFSNIKAVLLNTAQNGILVVGMTILMISGVFDLSIGSILALCGVVTGVLIANHDMPMLPAILIGLFVGGFTGLINGLVVTKMKINALITTLATMTIFRGITQLISGTGVASIDENFAQLGQTVWMGLQTPFWIALVIVVLAGWSVSKTRFFRQYYYIGGNERAAKLSGIKSEKMILIGFILMGVLAAIAGIVGASRLNSAVVSAGIGIELQIITATVLGGASLKGGEGTITGAALGVLFIQLIQNSLIIMKVDVFWQNIVIGLVLLVAVSLDRFNQKSF